jgi:hypothetical protein
MLFQLVLSWYPGIPGAAVVGGKREGRARPSAGYPGIERVVGGRAGWVSRYQWVVGCVRDADPREKPGGIPVPTLGRRCERLPETEKIGNPEGAR